MKLNDLKDGMILEARDGDRYLLLKGRMLNADGHIGLVDYSEDLKCVFNEDNDIVKIYEDTLAYSLRSMFQDGHLSVIWERKETKLTDREIEILKATKILGFKYIARDRNNDLYAYDKKPKRLDYVWNGGHITYIAYSELFNFIKWENDEPTYIDDLLKEKRN